MPNLITVTSQAGSGTGSRKEAIAPPHSNKPLALPSAMLNQPLP